MYLFCDDVGEWDDDDDDDDDERISSINRWHSTYYIIYFSTQDNPYTILTIFLLGRPRPSFGLKIDFWGGALYNNCCKKPLYTIDPSSGLDGHGLL